MNMLARRAMSSPHSLCRDPNETAPVRPSRPFPPRLSQQQHNGVADNSFCARSPPFRRQRRKGAKGRNCNPPPTTKQRRILAGHARKQASDAWIPQRPEGYRCVFLAASSTGATEAAVVSALKPGRGTPTCPHASHSPSSTSRRASMTGTGSVNG